MGDESTALVITKGDQVVGKISSDILPMLNPILQRTGGGGSEISTFANAAEAGLAFVEALGIREDIDDARDALADLKGARAKLYTYLQSAGTNINGATLVQLLRDVDVAQDAVDRAQTRAQNKATTALWGQVFGGIGRLIGNAQQGASGFANMLGFGGSSGNSSLGNLLLGGGIGALLASMFTGRRREEREEDDDNVPPIV